LANSDCDSDEERQVGGGETIEPSTNGGIGAAEPPWVVKAAEPEASEGKGGILADESKSSKLINANAPANSPANASAPNITFYFIFPLVSGPRQNGHVHRPLLALRRSARQQEQRYRRRIKRRQRWWPQRHCSCPTENRLPRGRSGALGVPVRKRSTVQS
jgi:hypothetical protein